MQTNVNKKTKSKILKIEMYKILHLFLAKRPRSDEIYMNI